MAAYEERMAAMAQAAAEGRQHAISGIVAVVGASTAAKKLRLRQQQLKQDASAQAAAQSTYFKRQKMLIGPSVCLVKILRMW